MTQNTKHPIKITKRQIKEIKSNILHCVKSQGKGYILRRDVSRQFVPEYRS